MSDKTLDEQFQKLLNAMKESRDDLVSFYATDLFKNPTDQSPIMENIKAFEKFADCEIIYSGKKFMGFTVGYIFYMGYKYYFG